MIRFCDKEVCSVSYEELNRSIILDYFFKGNIDEIVCVIDEKGKYKGKIIYYSLINTDNVFDAVQEEYIVLDHNIWQKARYYFSHYQRKMNEPVLLPVLNKKGQLLCFAYDDGDNDSNREIRLLRELSDNSYALQFSDIYSEYTCVKIYGFNELAYFFAVYLKKQNIPVRVYGELWSDLFEDIYYLDLDYKCMTIFAEGVNPKKSDWIDNLTESVSVEFECIDIIYEANIKKGIFKDAEGNCADLLSRLKDKKEIIILGTGREAQDVYDFLLKNDIDICCFVHESYNERTHKMFGKEILNSLDVRNKYRNPIFIECLNKHSAWGFGGTDYYDYIGYKRNESFYLIRDYMDVPGNSLLNILKNKKLVLLGDIDLCIYLKFFFARKMLSVKGYLDVDHRNDKKWMIPKINPEDIDEDSVCLFVIPEFNEIDHKQKQNEKKRRMSDYLKANGLVDFTDYFSYTASFIEIEECNVVKYTKEEFIPKRIVLGSIEARSGNTFFRGLLDSHPSITMMNFCNLNHNLFWVCICLSTKKSKQILPAFWKMCEQEEFIGIYQDLGAFNEKMEQLLRLDEHFTSQELFIMFHIAFTSMYGKDLSKENIKKSVVFWEPHHVHRTDVEGFAGWLGANEVKCDIVNVVRNICMRNASGMKNILLNKEDKRSAFSYALSYPPIEKKDNKWGDRLVVKFEDLKCDPKTTLLKICNNWGIAWSDVLMETTQNGEKNYYDNGENIISGFDLKPVFDTNEKFLSAFDRFRMALINGPWQKKYGYPYVELLQFTRRELQEIFLKKFRFEDWIDYQSIKLERDFKIKLYSLIRYRLQKIRMIEILSEMNEK